MTTGSAANSKPAPDPATSGLEGIVAARTPLSEVDGLKGILTIRGYDIEQIAGRISLEEAVPALMTLDKAEGKGISVITRF